MSIKLSINLDTGEATALEEIGIASNWKKFQKMKHNLSKISALFHLFILCLMILIWILTILTSTS